MTKLTDSKTVKAMLADPKQAVARYDFKLEIGPSFTSDCNLQCTPDKKSEDPRIGTNAVAPATSSKRARGGRATRISAIPAGVEAQDSEVYRDAEELAADLRPDLIFTHGVKPIALDVKPIIKLIAGFARTHRVLSFLDLRPHNQRAESFRALRNSFSNVRAIRGRSYGSQACARASLHGPTKSLVFLSYPLVCTLMMSWEQNTSECCFLVSPNSFATIVN
jgi:hypothetical protein